MNKRTVKTLLIALKIVITILFVIVVNRSIPAERTDLSSLIPLHLLIPVTVLSLISTTIQAYRWYLFLKLFGLHPTIGQSFRSYLEGVLFGIITPGRAGELFRGFTLKPEWRKTASIAVVTEKIVATIILFITGIAAWFFLPGNRGGTLYCFGIIGASLVATAIIPVIPFLIKRFYPTVKEVRRRFMGTLLLSIPIHLLLLFQIVILFSGRTPLSVFESITTAASAFSAMQFMPVTIANMGVREFCLTIFTQLHIPEDYSIISMHYTILSSSLIIIIANLLIPAVPGILILLTSRLSGGSKEKVEKQLR